jgi:hypothetical protein
MNIFTSNKRFHDAPWLQIRDKEIFNGFLNRFGIRPGQDGDMLINRLNQALGHIPFENLTKIIKADSVISASSAMRYPDELIGDFLKWGTGGTCFSLTAAAVALLDGLGIEAYPLLADRHYGPDTHCGLVMVRPGGAMLLLDPGYLLFSPVPVPKETAAFFDTGFNRIELVPVLGGTRVELYTVVKNSRKLRLTFKIEPVSDASFAAAWERSFAFEMMTYPVLTRQSNGRHEYLQGNVLAVRDASRTERVVLTPDKQIEFFSATAGIQMDIVKRALEIVDYGKNSIAARG